LKILVINAGSSSLKYQLFNTENADVLAKGVCERIGIDGKIKHTTGDGRVFAADKSMKTHSDAIREVTQLLTAGDCSVISSMGEIDAVGHRVLHAGSEFSGSMLVTDSVIDAIRRCIPLGPLHNPANLTGILACEKEMGDIPQVAVFDTAFHQTMPEKAYLYAIPYEYYEKYQIRRYGFHGTSHRYVSAKAAEFLGRPVSDLKIVTCHLGNGSSIAAVDGGRSVDTSMGLTPLEGVPMGTRSGSIDPAIIEYIMKNEKIDDISTAIDILNKKSGVLGVSGVSSDFRDLDRAAAEGNRRAQAALDCFTYSIKKYVGAYAAAMCGIDVLVFTAGIGENNREVRKNVYEGLEFMGIGVDDEKNNALNGSLADISAAGSRVRTLIIPTDEEFVIAADTEEIVSALR
jgi:acetate kinase